MVLETPGDLADRSAGAPASHEPFDLPLVDDIMTQTGRDVSTAELYVLPQ